LFGERMDTVTASVGYNPCQHLEPVGYWCYSNSGYSVLHF